MMREHHRVREVAKTDDKRHKIGALLESAVLVASGFAAMAVIYRLTWPAGYWTVASVTAALLAVAVCVAALRVGKRQGRNSSAGWVSDLVGDGARLTAAATMLAVVSDGTPGLGLLALRIDLLVALWLAALGIAAARRVGNLQTASRAGAG
jgi:hypothetical protein